MENVPVDLSNQTNIKVSDLETGEKENINVVIVPESILQAIKNSSNLHANVADTVASSVSNLNTDEQCDEIASVDSSNLSNGNLWISFPSDAYCIGSETPSTDADSAPKPTNDDTLSNPHTAPYVEIGGIDQTVHLNVQDNGLMQLPLLQNCFLIPSVFSNELDAQNTFQLESMTTPSNSATTYLTMRIQSVENDGDKSIYTLAPATTFDSTVQQVTTSTFSQANAAYNKTVGTLTDPIKSNEITLPTLPTSASLMSPQPVEKQVVETADKATYAGGPKPLYKCEMDNCNEVFRSALQYRRHKTTAHEKEKVYKCKYANCMWSFHTPYKLKRHLESHYQRKPYSCPYPGCNVVFSSDYNQRAHMKLHTTVTASRVCKVCGEITSSKRDLAAHMRNIHNKIPEFTCKICGKNCQTSAALTIHQRSHNPQLEYNCPMCGKKFTKRYYLKIHLYTHTGERPFQCDQCDWAFVSLSRLNRHMLTHREKKRFKCSSENCDKEFHRLDHLVQHLRMKHGIQPGNEGKILQEHLNEATGGEQKYFTCEACGFGFLSCHGLSRHKVKCQEHLANSAGVSTSDDVVEIEVDLPGMEESQANFQHAIQNKKDESSSKDPENFLESIDSDTILKITPFTCEVLSDTPSAVVPSQHRSPVKLNETCSITPAPAQISNATNALTELDSTWAATLINRPDALTDNIRSSRYLSCQSGESESQVTLVPFIEDMSVLNDATTQQFLQLNDDIGSCAESVSVTVDANMENQPETTDVLHQYVVDSNGLSNMIEINDDLHITPSYVPHNSNGADEVSAPNLFDDGIPLASIDDSRNIMPAAHFSGTTINLNDIH